MTAFDGFEGFSGGDGGGIPFYSAEFAGTGGVSIDPGIDPGGGLNIDIGFGGGGVGGGGGTPSVNQTLTQIVNSFEAALKANLAAWQVQNKTASVATDFGWQLMNQMVAAVRAYGAAGVKAAAERDRRVNPSMLRWDWIAYYIEPITGPITVTPDVPGGSLPGGAAGTGGGGSTLLPTTIAGINPLWIVAGAVILILVLRR
jgi:hypothetical protein